MVGGVERAVVAEICAGVVVVVVGGQTGGRNVRVRRREGTYL